MATQTRNLTVTFLLHNGIKQPEMEEKGHFYKIYSTEKIKLRPRDDYHFDLKFNIETPKELSPWLVILPSLKGMGPLEWKIFVAVITLMNFVCFF